MAGELILNEVAQTSPSTPASGKDAIYMENTTPARLARKDSSGNVLYVAEQYHISLSADFTLANQTAAQKFFNAPTNGTITLPGSTAWKVMGCLIITNTGTTSHQFQFALGGTATFSTGTQLFIQGNSASSAAPATGALQGWTSTPGTLVTCTPASTSATENATIMVDGLLRINAAGTIIPQIGETVASGVAPVAKAGSFFWLSPLGSNTVQSLGPWT